MKLPTKIPTIVALMLLAVVVSSIVLVFEKLSRGGAAASDSVQPTNIQVTNISDSSFTVSWTTNLPATGIITYLAPKQRSQTGYDDRDVPSGSIGTSGKLGKYQTHTVSVNALTPDTAYEVKILSAGKIFPVDGAPWSAKTGPLLGPSKSSLEPAHGTMFTASGKPAEGALVYLTLAGSETLSTTVKASGSWLIPLNLIRTQDTMQFLPTAERITENIFVRYNDEEATAITDTLNDSPVPEMIIGKTYDFRKQQANAADALANRLTTSAVLGAQAVQTGTSGVSLVQPVEGARLTTNVPLIQGTGIPGKKITMTLGIIKPITGTTTVGSDSIWRYTPTKPLNSGKQSITMTTVNGQNKPVAITHTFSIFKSGTQVLGDATPSATLAPTETPTPTLIPTLEETLTPTPTPEATISATPTPTTNLNAQTPPNSGTTFPTVLLVTIGFILLTGGAVVFVQ